MPITQSEAEQIVDIVLEHIEPEIAFELLNRFVLEVAWEIPLVPAVEENKSLRATLIMLTDYVKFRLTNAQ